MHTNQVSNVEKHNNHIYFMVSDFRQKKSKNRLFSLKFMIGKKKFMCHDKKEGIFKFNATKCIRINYQELKKHDITHILQTRVIELKYLFLFFFNICKNLQARILFQNKHNL